MAVGNERRDEGTRVHRQGCVCEDGGNDGDELPTIPKHAQRKVPWRVQSGSKRPTRPLDPLQADGAHSKTALAAYRSSRCWAVFPAYRASRPDGS